MKPDVAYLIQQLLQYDKVLTIQRTKKGLLMVSFSDMDEVGDNLVFVPEQIMKSESELGDALLAFNQHQEMLRMENYQA